MPYLLKHHLSKQTKPKPKPTPTPKSPQSNLLKIIISNTSSFKYYKINFIFLVSYSIYSSIYGYFLEYPDHLKKTIRLFGLLTSSATFLLFSFSNRHVKSLIINKTSNELVIETFRGFGFLPSKTYVLSVNKHVKYCYSLHSKLRVVDPRIYVLQLRGSNLKLFSICNCFYFRPVDVVDKEEFNELIRKTRKV